MTRGEGGWLFLPSAGLSPAILRQLAWRTSPDSPTPFASLTTTSPTKVRAEVAGNHPRHQRAAPRDRRPVPGPRRFDARPRRGRTPATSRTRTRRARTRRGRWSPPAIPSSPSRSTLADDNQILHLDIPALGVDGVLPIDHRPARPEPGRADLSPHAKTSSSSSRPPRRAIPNRPGAAFGAEVLSLTFHKRHLSCRRPLRRTAYPAPSSGATSRPSPAAALALSAFRCDLQERHLRPGLRVVLRRREPRGPLHRPLRGVRHRRVRRSGPRRLTSDPAEGLRRHLSQRRSRTCQRRNGRRGSRRVGGSLGARSVVIGRTREPAARPLDQGSTGFACILKLVEQPRTRGRQRPAGPHQVPDVLDRRPDHLLGAGLVPGAGRPRGNHPGLKFHRSRAAVERVLRTRRTTGSGLNPRAICPTIQSFSHLAALRQRLPHDLRVAVVTPGVDRVLAAEPQYDPAPPPRPLGPISVPMLTLSGHCFRVAPGDGGSVAMPPWAHAASG